MIGRFVFRLERVLRHRASLRDLREQELAAVESALAREREALVELFAQRDEFVAELAALQSGTFVALEREPYTRHLGWLASETARQRGRIADVERVRDEKRAALVKAMQEHRIVDRLRERQHEEHRVLAARDNQTFLDELASGAHARARLEGAQ